MHWALQEIQCLVTQLEDDAGDISSNCGYELYSRLLRAAKDLATCASIKDSLAQLDTLIEYAHESMSTSPHGSILTAWRRLYADACILRSLADVESSTREAIARLDRAIIIAGAPGPNRLEFIHALIKKIQIEILGAPSEFHDFHRASIISAPTESKVFASSGTVPCLSSPPSLGAFREQYSRRPFILRGFACSWPALQEHPWSSIDYLRAIAGPGRIVPVEVGYDYREDDWTQKLMGWDEFLAHTGLECTSTPSDEKAPVLYLAQHNLLMQFPALEDDICIPDYVYASSSPVDYPAYRPPGNDDQLVINAWLGPKGTVSPAHTDPYFNLYTQVVGYKTVWLAPPHSSNSMYPLSRSGANHSAPLDNTSAVNVFMESDDGSFPDFWTDVVPHTMSATLQPGDMLFFPPGWWHAMRSETASFSVSMWF